jgi:hypothetical protein
MNDELGRMLKETVVAHTECSSSICMEEMGKIMKNLSETEFIPAILVPQRFKTARDLIPPVL